MADSTGHNIYKKFIYELDQKTSGGDAQYGVLRGLAQITTASFGGTTNDQTAEEPTSYPTPVRLPGHKRRYGITARYVVIERTIGTGSTAFKIQRIIPILTKVLFETIVPGIAISYQSQDDWVFVSRFAENHDWQT